MPKLLENRYYDWSFPGHSLLRRGLKSVEAVPSQFKADLFDELLIQPLEPYRNDEGWMYRVALKGRRDNVQVMEHLLEFQLHKDADQVQNWRSLLYLLALYSANGPAMVTNVTTPSAPNIKVQLLPVCGLDVEMTESQMELAKAHLLDIVWQNKVTNFYGAACRTSEPTEGLTILSEFLPDFPYPDLMARLKVTSEERSQHLQWLRSLDSEILKQSVLSMSFGKESMLTYAILSRLFGKKQCEEDLTFGVVHHVGAPFQTSYPEQVKNFAKVCGGAPKAVISTSPVMQSNFETLFEQDAWSVHLQHIYLILHLLNTQKTYVLMGDEYERSVAHPVKLSSPVDSHECWAYTYDYSQSYTWHLKFNALFERLNINAKIGSLLYNVSELQIQYLLARMQPDFLQFQLSCWYANAEAEWCNSCSKCYRIAYMSQALDLPHPRGLDPFQPVSVRHGRDCFAMELGSPDPADHGWEKNGIGEFLDICFDAGLRKLRGDSYLPVKRLTKIQPYDVDHPQINAGVENLLNFYLARHPLGA